MPDRILLGPVGPSLNGVSVLISDTFLGPGVLFIGKPPRTVVLPRTRPSIQFPLYEAVAITAGITPWYFDPAKWPDRIEIDWSALDTRPPWEWEKVAGLKVHDPDGWRGEGGRPWHDPISRAEFDRRAAASTVERTVCRERVWLDGAYPTTCGRHLVRGKCSRHG